MFLYVQTFFWDHNLLQGTTTYQEYLLTAKHDHYATRKRLKKTGLSGQKAHVWEKLNSSVMILTYQDSSRSIVSILLMQKPIFYITS